MQRKPSRRVRNPKLDLACDELRDPLLREGARRLLMAAALAMAPAAYAQEG